MAEKKGGANFPPPSNSAVLRSEHLEFQESGLQSDRNVSRGPRRQLGGTEDFFNEQIKAHLVEGPNHHSE